MRTAEGQWGKKLRRDFQRALGESGFGSSPALCHILDGLFITDWTTLRSAVMDAHC